MIKFRCSNCNKKFGVPDDYAGRRIRCNTCDQHTFVPKSAAQVTILPSIPDRVAAEPSEVGGGVPASGGPMELSQKPQDAQIELQPPFQFEEFKLSPEEDLPPMDPNLEAIRQASRLRAQHSAETTKTDEKPERFPAKEAVASPDWYWPFVFPIRGAAMGMIGVFIVCEIVISFLAVIPIISLIVFLFSLIVRAYIFWYLYLCVQTAAEGKIRSPDILQEDEGDFLGMIWRMLRMILAVFFCMAPAIIYFVWTNAAILTGTNTGNAGIDGVFWSMFAAGLFFLPMTLLSIVMHDSIGGLNPFLIVWSVLRTLLKYLVLAACFSIPLGLTFVVNLFSSRLGFWFALPAEVLSYYLAFVGAAMLGRFFYINEERLNWNM
jgi:DNA-directed RNA polymerase subunit RPC12/RpoP